MRQCIVAAPDEGTAHTHIKSRTARLNDKVERYPAISDPGALSGCGR
jgi:hypothetical protein